MDNIGGKIESYMSYDGGKNEQFSIREFDMSEGRVNRKKIFGKRYLTKKGKGRRSMIKKATPTILALAVLASMCAVPALAADDTTQMNYYAVCWSIDALGKVQVTPLGATGEYATWGEVLDAIKNHDVSGYADYRFGVIVGIEAERALEVSAGILLPAKTYMVLGHVTVTEAIEIEGGENSRIAVTEWCNMRGRGKLANIAGVLESNALYAWDGATGEWVQGSGSADDPFPFPWGTYPRAPEPSAQTPGETLPPADGGGDTPAEPAGDGPLTVCGGTVTGAGAAMRDDGSVALPCGGTIATHGGAVITVSAGTTVGADGKITLPDGGICTITYGGYTFNITRDAIITLDENAPFGYTLAVRNPFGDIADGDWFCDDVMYVYARGLMVGTGTDPMTFDPNVTLSRAMAVTVLYRLNNAELTGENDGNSPFDDVAVGMWYTDAVAWAAEHGIVNGYGDGRFGPHDDITRQDLAAIIYRYEYRYEQFAGRVPADIVAAAEFADQNDISGYAASAVGALVGQGIIRGRPGNIFDPLGRATRAEFAAILHRFLSRSHS
jgi:hypothetical protein